MRFYRLEKKNYLRDWIYAIIKSAGIALLISIGLMLCFGYKFMIVSSGSMEPTLPVGSLVIVQPCDYDDLRLNDIVTMDANGIYLTHRVVGKMDHNNKIIEIGEEGYDSAFWYTKGDNSDTIDGRINKAIVGKVITSMTWIGEIVRYTKSNYQLLIILAVIFVVFFEVMQYLKGKLVIDDVETYETDEE